MTPVHSADQALLQIEDLRVAFGEGADQVLAVDGVSFAIKKGESIGIVGESGSGKSMTALSIMQLIPQSGRYETGRIHWQGQDLMKHSASNMRKVRGRAISMIFQEPLSSLNPVFRCGEQVAEGLRVHFNHSKQEAKRIAKEWLAKVHLPDPERIYRAYPHELSGGQRQRVMIAMALCTEPDLLIADEPTTALDVTVQQSILELLATLRKETRTSILFISHDLGVIRQMADRVMIMQSGKVVEEGSVETIFTQPAHPYTKGLLACRPPLDKRLRRLPVIEDFTDPEVPVSVAERLAALEESKAQYRARQAELEERTPLLTIDQLQVWFTREKNWWGRATSYVKAVDGISFQLRPGERLGVVGESGCGKTTLGRSIIRLVQAQAGAIRFKGEDILAIPEEQFRPFRPRIQMVFQDPFSSLNPRKTIGEALEEPLRIHRSQMSREERRLAIADILGKVGLSEGFVGRYPHEFSGGQRQRIGIARAILLRPEVLICDESVSALDVSVQAQVLNLIRDLQEEYQFSVIFISHDLSVIKFIADCILVMKEGQVVEYGPAEQVFHDPQAAYTKTLLAAIPR